jgi:hypothetical protein
MRRCKALEILSISGEDMGSASFHGLSHDEGIHRPGGAGRSQKSPGCAAMGFARLGHRADRLEHTVDRCVARATADRLGHDDHRDLN